MILSKLKPTAAAGIYYAPYHKCPECNSKLVSVGGTIFERCYHCANSLCRCSVSDWVDDPTEVAK